MTESRVPLSLRRQVAERARYRCEYCLTQQRLTGIKLTIDHIIPESLGGATDFDNLCQACWDCNQIKGNRIEGFDPESGVRIRLFNPVRQNWYDHFRWEKGGLWIVGLTPVGRATISMLKLNRFALVEARGFWIRAGWHPPKD
jgi:hypothetical protein